MITVYKTKHVSQPIARYVSGSSLEKLFNGHIP